MMAISDALFRLIYGVDRNEHMQLEEMLGYTFENDVPSALGQVEPFDASRHRFQIGAKVLHRQRELTFTVMGRINDMVRLQGLDDNEKKQIFYYPEQSKQLVLEGTPPTPPSSTRKGGTRPDKAVWHELLSAAGVNNGGRDGGTVMPTTLSEHRLAQLKSLLKRAGPDTVRAAFDPGENVELVYSVLHWVSQKDMGNYFKVGELLLTHGANPDPYDINGTTPLYLACVYGQSEVVRFLVRNGADVLRPSAGLLTPAHLLLDDGFNISKTLVVECLRSRRELIKDEVSATKTVNFDFTWLDHATVKPPLNFWFSDGDVGPWKNHVGGMSLLEVAVKTGSIEALEAPVVRRYIQHHWTLYARQGAIFDFGAALLLTGAVVLDTWFTPPRLADTHSLGWEVLPATLILVWAALLFAYELYSLVHKPKIWLIDKWNPVELLTYSLLVAYESCDLLAGLGMALAAEASTLTCLQAFSALFVWVRLLKYVGLFEKYGHYVSIIVKMLSEFTIFLVVVAAIYAGFTHAVRAHTDARARAHAHARGVCARGAPRLAARLRALTRARAPAPFAPRSSTCC